MMKINMRKGGKKSHQKGGEGEAKGKGKKGGESEEGMKKKRRGIGQG